MLRWNQDSFIMLFLIARVSSGFWGHYPQTKKRWLKLWLNRGFFVPSGPSPYPSFRRQKFPCPSVSPTENPLSLCFADTKSLVLLFRRQKSPCPYVSQTQIPLSFCFEDRKALALLFHRQKFPCPSVSQTKIPLSFVARTLDKFSFFPACMCQDIQMIWSSSFSIFVLPFRKFSDRKSLLDIGTKGLSVETPPLSLWALICYNQKKYAKTLELYIGKSLKRTKKKIFNMAARQRRSWYMRFLIKILSPFCCRPSPSQTNSFADLSTCNHIPLHSRWKGAIVEHKTFDGIIAN